MFIFLVNPKNLSKKTRIKHKFKLKTKNKTIVFNEGSIFFFPKTKGAGAPKIGAGPPSRGAGTPHPSASNLDSST